MPEQKKSKLHSLRHYGTNNKGVRRLKGARQWNADFEFVRICLMMREMWRKEKWFVEREEWLLLKQTDSNGQTVETIVETPRGVVKMDCWSEKNWNQEPKWRTQMSHPNSINSGGLNRSNWTDRELKWSLAKTFFSQFSQSSEKAHRLESLTSNFSLSFCKLFCLENWFTCAWLALFALFTQSNDQPVKLR